MPGAFFANQPEYTLSYQDDPEVVSYFSANNLTLYNSTWNFNITVGNIAVQEDTPIAGNQIEFWWEESSYLNPRQIYVKHVESPFLWIFPQTHLLALTSYYRTKSEMPSYQDAVLEKEQFLNLAISNNSAYWECFCSHITMNFLVMSMNETQTLEQAWDNGTLHVLSSYNIDFDAMKPGAFTLITQLLSFQNPDFGIPGLFGSIITYSLALAIWITIAIIIYTIITRLFPTIHGGIEN